MVDTVYSIVESDINLKASNVTSINSNSSENMNSSNCEKNQNRINSSVNSNSNEVNNRQVNLLKDMIKIIIIDEIKNRRQNNSNPMMSNIVPNNNFNQPLFM